MRDTTLVIMAAGIGSRYGGGIKQLEPVGPNGEIIMDYSIHDALETGFNKIIFIIRKDLEKDFKETIGYRIEKLVPVTYAYQELDALPDGYTNKWERTKPWGTGQAILSIKDLIATPFVVINADDYYGKEAFLKIHDYLINKIDIDQKETFDICMAGFLLNNTLSQNGGVTRGICNVDNNNKLLKVTETYEIQNCNGVLSGKDDKGNAIIIPDGKYVSMNMWGLAPAFVSELENGFKVFLDSLDSGDKKTEYLLPQIIDKMIHEKKAEVTLLETHDRWFGVTYKEDKEYVMSEIKQLIQQGQY